MSDKQNQQLRRILEDYKTGKRNTVITIKRIQNTINRNLSK